MSTCPHEHGEGSADDNRKRISVDRCLCQLPNLVVDDPVKPAAKGKPACVLATPSSLAQSNSLRWKDDFRLACDFHEV